MLHEYAHQWFGDAVGPAAWKDVWLNEGWATYAEALYTAERDGYDIEDWAQRARKSDADARQRLGPPGNPRADSFAESNVYVCPALMLHEIHKALGDKAFFALARDMGVAARRDGAGPGGVHGVREPADGPGLHEAHRRVAGLADDPGVGGPTRAARRRRRG